MTHFLTLLFFLYACGWSALIELSRHRNPEVSERAKLARYQGQAKVIRLLRNNFGPAYDVYDRVWCNDDIKDFAIRMSSPQDVYALAADKASMELLSAWVRTFVIDPRCAELLDPVVNRGFEPRFEGDQEDWGGNDWTRATKIMTLRALYSGHIRWVKQDIEKAINPWSSVAYDFWNGVRWRIEAELKGLTKELPR